MSGVLVTATALARPVLTFRNFTLRCDKSDPQVSFQTPWNWEIFEGKKIAVITTNAFLKYQLSAALAGLVSPVSGELVSDGVIGWPVGEEGGLDSKLRISHGLDFLSSIYEDCLENSCLSLEEFWDLLSTMEIEPNLIIKELSRDQRDYFFLALSVLFVFDIYLIPRTKFLMSKIARPLQAILLKQLEGKTLVSTSINSRFQREFCTEGLVLSPLGEILFAGGLSDAIQWANKNLELSNISSFDDDQFDVKLNLVNLDSSEDTMDDFV